MSSSLTTVISRTGMMRANLKWTIWILKHPTCSKLCQAQARIVSPSWWMIMSTLTLPTKQWQIWAWWGSAERLLLIADAIAIICRIHRSHPTRQVKSQTAVTLKSHKSCISRSAVAYRRRLKRAQVRNLPMTSTNSQLWLQSWAGSLLSRGQQLPSVVTNCLLICKRSLVRNFRSNRWANMCCLRIWWWIYRLEPPNAATSSTANRLRVRLQWLTA